MCFIYDLIYFQRVFQRKTKQKKWGDKFLNFKTQVANGQERSLNFIMLFKDTEPIDCIAQ